MEKMTFCQSCAMPIDDDAVKGTNKDASLSQEYCTYCYQDGEFTKDCTMDEMIDNCLHYLDEFNKDSEPKFSPEEALRSMKEFFPTLKRWSGK